MTQPTEPISRVVISDAERYSIWPQPKTHPWGWRPDQTVGTKHACPHSNKTG